MNGPLHDMYRRVECLTREDITLRAAGDGPGLVYSWSNRLIAGPIAFSASFIDAPDLRRLEPHRPVE